MLDPATAPDALDGAEAIFYLAAAVSRECEADFGPGIRANLRGTEALPKSCRAAGTSPALVSARPASSASWPWPVSGQDPVAAGTLGMEQDNRPPR